MPSLQDQFDDAMFEFSTGNIDGAIQGLRAILAQDPDYFDAQLSLGGAYYAKGDYTAAIAEGQKAEKIKPHDQLVHTNLSSAYMKSGDKTTAEHHGLQARIASWRGNMAPSERLRFRPGNGQTPAQTAAAKIPGNALEEKHTMKSAYELAMDRLSKTAPAAKLTNEQKKQLAELDSRYSAKIAEREIFLKDERAAAAAKGDFEAVTQLEKQLVSARKSLQAELEEKKEKIRQSE